MNCLQITLTFTFLYDTRHEKDLKLHGNAISNIINPANDFSKLEVQVKTAPGKTRKLSCNNNH